MATRGDREDDHERAAAGMDYDSPMHEKASELGSKLAEGPEALLEELENLLPESWREHIKQFPIVAVVLGFGVGVWLGMKKGEEVIAAGTSMASAAAMANVSKVMDRFSPGAGSDD